MTCLKHSCTIRSSFVGCRWQNFDNFQFSNGLRNGVSIPYLCVWYIEIRRRRRWKIKLRLSPLCLIRAFCAMYRSTVFTKYLYVQCNCKLYRTSALPFFFVVQWEIFPPIAPINGIYQVLWCCTSIDPRSSIIICSFHSLILTILTKFVSNRFNTLFGPYDIHCRWNRCCYDIEKSSSTWIMDWTRFSSVCHSFDPESIEEPKWQWNKPEHSLNSFK